MAIAVVALVIPDVRRVGWLIVLSLIVAIAGVITGIVALVGISKSGHKVRRFRTAYAGTLLCVLAALWMFVFLCRPADRWVEHEPGMRCQANLRNISLGLSAYQDDYHGELPNTLEGAYQYMPAPSLYVCPNDRKPMLIPDSFRYKERFPDGGLKCSYHYVGRLSPETDKRVILMYENAGNHSYKYKGNRVHNRHAAFADFHTEALTEDEFQAGLRESLELVKQAGWHSYSPERKAEIEAFYTDRPPR